MKLLVLSDLHLELWGPDADLDAQIRGAAA